MSTRPVHVFVAYSLPDRKTAQRITHDLRMRGFTVWLDASSVRPGQDWGDETERAIQGAAAVMALLSEASKSSAWLMRELELASTRNKPIVSVLLDAGEFPSALDAYVKSPQTVVFAGEYDDLLDRITGALLRLTGQPVRPSAGQPERDAGETALKGYVFLSYVRKDQDFADRLKGVLKKRGYAYWDYRVSDRNYHAALYRELEERIENAAAFISIVSDGWRDTEWTAAEYLYAREAQVPIFVIQAEGLKRPFPILLNQQTRIDMATDFDRGSAILERELDKEGL